eukprot:NODE_9_length_47730_cov_0.323718.p15 type:complete len:288 gc:universal NODE_9_length_47730_cov_0.323718:18019-18882(+)
MSSSAQDALKFLESLEGDLQSKQEPVKEEISDIKNISTESDSTPPIKEQPKTTELDSKTQKDQGQYKLPTSFSFGTFNTALKTYLKEENVQKAKENVSKNVSSMASAFISSFNVPPSLQIKCNVNSPLPLNQDTKYTLQEIWGNATHGRWGFDYDVKENHKVLFSNNWNELVSVIKSDVKQTDDLSITLIINQFRWLDAEFNNENTTGNSIDSKEKTISSTYKDTEMESNLDLPAQLKLEGYVFLIKVLDIVEVGLIHGRYCQNMLWGLIENAFEQCGRQFQLKYAK